MKSSIWSKYFLATILLTASTFTWSEDWSKESQIVYGELQHEVVDYEDGTSEDLFFLKDKKSGKMRKLEFPKGKVPKALAGALSGSIVKIRGKKSDTTVLADFADDSDILEDELDVVTFPTSAVKGTKKILVAVVDWNDAVAACNATTAYTKILDPNNSKSVKSVMKKNSQNLVDFVGEVASIKVNHNASSVVSCNNEYDDWQADADAVLKAKGYVLSNYHHIMYIFPRDYANCTWGGKGILYGKLTWIRNCYDKTLSHEIGHNFGMHHASSEGSSSQYSDYSCPMGSALTEFNAPHKQQVGWVPLEKTKDINTNGTYRLSPHTQASSSASYPQVYRIHDASKSTYYYLSFRDKAGTYDSALSATYADRLNITRYNGNGSNLTYFMNALGAGSSHSLPNGMIVKNVSQTSSYLEFSLSNAGSGTGGTGDTTKPVVAITSPANGALVAAGTIMNVTASASDNVGVTRVDFYAGGYRQCIDTAAPYSCSHAMISASHWPLYAQAFDAAGNSTISEYVYLGNPTTGDSVAPSISLTSPQNGASYNAGSSVTVSASASDNVGVTKVNFYVGGSLKSSDTAAPYSYSFSMPTSSSLQVYARAYDAAGNYKNSAISYIKNPSTTDTTAPTVSLSSPANGATYAVGAMVSASASASDNVGVAKVNFYVGGALKKSDTAAPYSYSFSMPTSSSLQVYARAYDAAGNYKNSAISYIKNPSSVDTTRPSVTLTSPANGSSFAAGSYVAASASASDNVGVARVVFMVNGVTQCNDSSSPYSCNFLMPTGSNISVYAKAYDAAGNWINSSLHYISSSSTADTTAPSVSLTSPSSGSSFTAGSSVNASASASDNVGVTKVNFYVAGSLKCSLSASPYSCSFPMPTGSSISVYARAYDAAGNYKNSSTSLISSSAAPTTDTTPPSVPGNVSLSTKRKNNVIISFSPSSDNVGVARYEILRNGAQIGSTTSTSYTNSRVADGTHSYEVRAVDKAGNKSSLSSAVSISIGRSSGGNDGGDGGDSGDTGSKGKGNGRKK